MEWTWYDVKVDTCFRSPYNNLLELMLMESAYELNARNFKNEKEFIGAVRRKQEEEEEKTKQTGGDISWVEYIKQTKPRGYERLLWWCSQYKLDINTITSFDHLVRELNRRAILSG